MSLTDAPAQPVAAGRFRPLTVAAVHRDTRDAVVVTLAPRPEDAAAFAFVQGQYLTLRREIAGTEIRRSYSICAGCDDGLLQVAIKRVDGGAFSTWANTELRPGDVVEAMPPQGRFFAPLAPDAARHHLLVAAGSGITPILSIAKTALAREPLSRVTLVYANRQVSSIMFREALEDLKNLHLGRLSVIHVLRAEAQEIDLFTGRIDADKMDALFAHWIDPGSIDWAYVCGPESLMQIVEDGLARHGIPRDRIKTERFASAQPGRLATQAALPSAAEAGATCTLTVTLDGTTHTLAMPRDGSAVLDAALAGALDAPYSCRAGVCSTCRARVTEGAVEMAVNHALEDDEVRDGYVLTCQAVPVTDRLVLTYDH